MGGWGAWLLGKIRAKKRMTEWLAGSLGSPERRSDLINKQKRTGMKVNGWLVGLASWENKSKEKDE